MRISNRGVTTSLLAASLLGSSLPALADTERLEADLQALFADEETLEIGEVSKAFLRSQFSASDLHAVGPDGEQLWLDSYVVSGDYDRPDEVRMEGFKLETSGHDELRLIADAETLTLEEPSLAVLPLHEQEALEAFTVAGLVAEALAVEFAERGAGQEDGGGSGRFSIESLQASGVSRNAIDSLTLSGLEGQAENVDEFGSGTFSLGSALVEGLRGLQRDEGEQELDRLELRDLTLDSDRLAATLTALDIDTDMANGEGRFRLEALELDLARLIDQAPQGQRTQLRMASNILTDGSGTLRLDADSSGRWETDGAATQLLGEMNITADKAFGWTLDADLPVRLPEGVEPEAFLAEMEGLEDVTLLGGTIDMTLTELGLFGRLPAIMATAQGVSEAAFMEQAHTQAKGFGQMLGPEVGAIFTGLLAMMEGSAEALDIHLTLPADSELEALSADPLALPERLDMQVESR